MSDPVVPTIPPRRGMKLPAGVVTLLILLAVAGGVWWTWQQLFASHTVDQSQYESNDSPTAIARSRMMNTPTTNPADLIFRRDDGTGDIRLPSARAHFGKTDGKPTVELTYTGQPFIANEDRLAVMARFTAISDKKTADAAKITKEQIDKLKALTLSHDVPATEAQKAKLVDAWTRSTAAAPSDRAALESPMVAEFEQIAIAGMDATTTAAAQTGNQIRAILTPNQLVELRPRIRRNRPLP